MNDAILTESDRLLLVAALDETERAVEAWQRWSETYSLDSIRGGTYWILPLLYRNLSASDVDHHERRRLAGVYKKLKTGNAITLPRVLDAIERLRAHDISVLPGPLASLVLTGIETAVALRPAELLVPAKELDAADGIVQGLGFRPQLPIPPTDLRPFIDAVRYVGDGGLELSLQWRPFGTEAVLDADAGCWERAIDGLPDATDRLLMTYQRGTHFQLAVVRDRLRSDIEPAVANARAVAVGLSLDGDLTPNAAHRPSGTVATALGHRRRYRRCPTGSRPATLFSYLIKYYRYVWQREGLPSGLNGAIRRSFAR